MKITFATNAFLHTAKEAISNKLVLPKLIAAVLLAGMWMGLGTESAQANPPPPWPTNVVVPSVAVSGGTASATRFSFNVNGNPPSSQWQVFSTSDLISWTLAGSVTLGAQGTATFSDGQTAGVPQRFYLVVKQISGTWYYSRGIGFERITAVPGLTAITDQLAASPNNTLASVFAQSALPSGTLIAKYNGTGIDSYTWSANTWSPSGSATLAPGEGAFIQNNAGSQFPVTFVGLVPEGALVKTLPPGYSLVGSMVPMSGGITSNLGYLPNDGDGVLIWDPTIQNYSQYYVYIEGYGWDDGEFNGPSEPVIKAGQGFYLFNASSTRNWTTSFSMFSSWYRFWAS